MHTKIVKQLKAVEAGILSKKIMTAEDFSKKTGVSLTPMANRGSLRTNEVCYENGGFIVVFNDGRAWRCDSQLDIDEFRKRNIVEVSPELLALRALNYVSAPRDLPLLEKNQFCDLGGPIYFRLGDGLLRHAIGKEKNVFLRLGLTEVIKKGLFEEKGIEPRPFRVVGRKG